MGDGNGDEDRSLDWGSKYGRHDDTCEWAGWLLGMRHAQILSKDETFELSEWCRGRVGWKSLCACDQRLDVRWGLRPEREKKDGGEKIKGYWLRIWNRMLTAWRRDVQDKLFKQMSEGLGEEVIDARERFGKVRKDE